MAMMIQLMIRHGNGGLNHVRSELCSGGRYELDRSEAKGITETFNTVATDTIPVEIKRTRIRRSQFRPLTDAIDSLTLSRLWSSVSFCDQ